MPWSDLFVFLLTVSSWPSFYPVILISVHTIHAFEWSTSHGNVMKNICIYQSRKINTDDLDKTNGNVYFLKLWIISYASLYYRWDIFTGNLHVFTQFTIFEPIQLQILHVYCTYFAKEKLFKYFRQTYRLLLHCTCLVICLHTLLNLSARSDLRIIRNSRLWNGSNRTFSIY